MCLQEERTRNRQIMETLEKEKNDLANEHGRLACMLSQTQARSISTLILEFCMMVTVKCA